MTTVELGKTLTSKNQSPQKPWVETSRHAPSSSNTREVVMQGFNGCIRADLTKELSSEVSQLIVSQRIENLQSDRWEHDQRLTGTDTVTWEMSELTTVSKGHSIYEKPLYFQYRLTNQSMNINYWNHSLNSLIYKTLWHFADPTYIGLSNMTEGSCVEDAS